MEGTSATAPVFQVLRPLVYFGDLSRAKVLTIIGIRVKRFNVAKAKPEALEAMQESPYNYGDTRWAAFENHALDSSTCGELRFLAVGPQNTCSEAPDRYPDTQQLGVGWKFVHIGWVNLETGDIENDRENPAPSKSLTA
jgi:hypothetical protein